jgi:hypothetical protein
MGAAQHPDILTRGGAMRVTRYQGEKNLQDLAGRLYKVGDPAAMAAVTAQLADANPNLPLGQPGALGKAIAPGTLIVVPDVVGATLTDASQPVGDAVGQALLERTKQAIAQMGPELEAERRQSVADLKTTLELIASKDFQAAAKRDKELAAALATVGENAKARLDDLDAAGGDQQLAIDGAQRAVEGLLELANSRSAEAAKRPG